MGHVDVLTGRTAVVTGAAGGLGSAIARAVAREGMAVAVADVDADGLARTEHDLRALGGRVLAVPTDVADPAAVDALADRCHAELGDVHLLCNHAGVIVTGESWLAPLEDWRWVMGVNLGGVVNTLRSFLPRMLAHGAPGHVVNASSIGALLTEPLAAPYVAALRAVVTVSETLHHELRRIDAPIGVSVLCPGAVATNLEHADEHRPAKLARPVGWEQSAVGRASMDRKAQGMAAGAPPDDVARHVVDGIRAGRFWIFAPDVGRYEAKLRTALDRMLAGEAPVEAFPWS
jgi:NAD(P)-dependent dehydrogenase (short-subunit alcohol dehydrogenase family)